MMKCMELSVPYNAAIALPYLIIFGQVHANIPVIEKLWKVTVVHQSLVKHFYCLNQI